MSIDYEDFYDNMYENDVYNQIINNNNPHLINNVSMMRHYINCYGITQSLCDFLKLTKDEIEEVKDNCFGTTKIEDVRKNYKEIVKRDSEDKMKKELAHIKNEQLISQLYDKRENICGLGTRRLKLLLNSLVSKGNDNALIIRKLLEAEDENIKAKENFYYSEYHYNRKYELIKEIISKYKEIGWIYGYQKSDIKNVKHIIYFELPGDVQISFHVDLGKELSDIPEYRKEWDGAINSTLPKIETFCNEYFKDEIEKKILYYLKKDKYK